jgi:hypothetical protein
MINKKKAIAKAVKSMVMVLPENLRWTPHNLVAHPLSEVVFLTSVITNQLFGRGKTLYRFNNWLHDVTIPTHEEGTGRG